MRILRSIRFWQVTAMVLALLLVGGVVGATVAGVAPTSISAGAAKSVKVLRQGSAIEYSGTSYQDVASTTISVPGGHTAVLVMNFAAESDCYGAAVGHYCTVTIYVDGVEAYPQMATDFAFDSVDSASAAAGDGTWEGHSVQRTSAVLGAGSHTILVRARTTDGSVTLRLDDWSLVIERFQKT